MYFYELLKLLATISIDDMVVLPTALVSEVRSSYIINVHHGRREKAKTKQGPKYTVHAPTDLPKIGIVWFGGLARQKDRVYRRYNQKNQEVDKYQPE